MSPPAIRPFVDAVKARLEAATGAAVGNAVAPNIAPPYLVLYMLPGGEVDGPSAAPVDDAALSFQVTAVGSGPEQALWQSDKARDALVGWAPTVTGRSVMPIQLEFASGGVSRDDDLPTALFYAVDRFTAWSFPA